MIKRFIRPMIPKHWLALRRALQQYRTMLQKPQATARGFLFGGNALMVSGEFEPEEVRLFQRAMLENDILINVGANIGYYMCLARQLGKAAIGFEPIPSNLQHLYRNLDANGWNDCEVFPVGLSDESGLATIWGAGTGASMVQGWAGTSADHKQIIPVHTLDSVLGERFLDKRILLLIDVEGAELRMLRGAQAVLSRRPAPIIMIEICVSEHQPSGIKVNPDLSATFTLLWDMGYMVYRATGNRRKVEREEVAETANGHNDRLGTHNFIAFAGPPPTFLSA